MRTTTKQAKNAYLDLLLCTALVIHTVLHIVGNTHGSISAPTASALTIGILHLNQRPLNEKALRFALDASFPSFAKLTLIGLAYLADENGVVETSLEGLGSWCCQRPLYVKRGLAMLMEAGVVKAQGLGKGRGSVRYRIVGF